MAPMVLTRPGPTATAAARYLRGERFARPAIRALRTTRGVATAAAVQETRGEYPGAVVPPVSGRSLQERKEAIRSAKPFSEFLTDSFNRQHDYLRISITERCNLRCLYCMPEEGIPLSPPATMLTTPEIFYLSSLFVSQGVTKIRLTGGEPTVRRDIVPLMQSIGSLRSNGLRELALTTNGISLHRKLDAMVEAGLTGVNLSLDTLDPFQFQIMTRRKGFDAVMQSIDRILEMNKLGANIKLKVNCVVMRGLNERDIIPFVEMGREKDIEVRFIEYMPFGGNKWSQGKMISYQEMLDIIRVKHPGLRRMPGHKNDTSKTYQVPGFVGKVGFISSMTNDFCGTCNRLRITSDGNLKVCLHGNAEVSLRDLLRQDNNGEPIDEEAFARIKKMEMDRRDGLLSDETTFGWGPREQELLQVIGAAVKRKAEKHADMGDLEKMQNRPMILIDQPRSSPSPSRPTDPAQAHYKRTLVSGSGASLRSWSSIPAPHLHFLYPSFSTTHLQTRAFTSSTRLSSRLSKALERREAASIKAARIKGDIKKLQEYDEKRKRKEESMLAVLEKQKKSKDAQLRKIRAAGDLGNMNSPDFAEYWHALRLAEKKRGKGFSYAMEKTKRVLKKIHKDITWDEVQSQVDSDAEMIRQEEKQKQDEDHQREKKKEGMSKNTRRQLENNGDISARQAMNVFELRAYEKQRLLPLNLLRNKVTELEERIKLEKAYPPTEEPPDFKEFAATGIKFGMGRLTKRALWRQRKKIAAGGERNKVEIEKDWKAGLEEMEATLAKFRAFEEQYKTGLSEPEANFERARERAEGLMEKMEVEEIRDRPVNHIKSVVKEKRKRLEIEKVSEKKDALDERRSEMRWRMRPESAQDDRESDESLEVMKMEDTSTWRSRKEEPSPAKETKWQRDIASQTGLDAGLDTAGGEPTLEQLRERRAALLKQREEVLKKLTQKTRPDTTDGKPTLEQLRERHAALLKQREEALENMLSEETPQADVLTNWDHLVKRPVALEREHGEVLNLLDDAIAHEENIDPEASLKLLKVRREALMKQRQEKLGELKKHRIPGPANSPELRLENLVPKPHIDSAAERMQQVRDLSQSIAFLKKFTAKAKPGDESSKAAERVQGMLEELHGQIATPTKEEKGVEEEEEMSNEGVLTRIDGAPTVRKTNDWQKNRLFPNVHRANPPAVPEAPEPEHNNDATPLQATKSRSVFGSTNKPEPIRPSWPEPQKPVLSLADGLKLQMPSSNTIQIDPSLRIDLESPVPELQSQIYQMRELLKNAYPRINTLPYDVWTSSNRTTLRTWLKILVQKWQTRFDDFPQRARDECASNGNIDDNVREVLDQMVRAHDLSPEASERMAQRWVDVFGWKGVPEEVRKADEESLDWDEFDAGMGWLRNEADEGPEKELAGEAPKELGKDALKDYFLPDNLPFTWDTKEEKGYRRAAVKSRKLHRLVPAAKRRYSTSSRPLIDPDQAYTLESKTASSEIQKAAASASATPSLPHLTSSGTAHMVSVASKPRTLRTAIAFGVVRFSNHTPLNLIRSNSNKKGDVLSVSRIAGIMAAKKCPDIVPLCHPIMLTHVGVELSPFDDGAADKFGGVMIEAKVQCEGQTGVEMEALAAVMGTALSVVDMCKAVDKGMRVDGVRVVLKEGGRSGVWREEGWESSSGKM